MIFIFILRRVNKDTLLSLQSDCSSLLGISRAFRFLDTYNCSSSTTDFVKATVACEVIRIAYYGFTI